MALQQPKHQPREQNQGEPVARKEREESRVKNMDTLLDGYKVVLQGARKGEPVPSNSADTEKP